MPGAYLIGGHVHSSGSRLDARTTGRRDTTPVSLSRPRSVGKVWICNTQSQL
jgi:hypothetical protein